MADNGPRSPIPVGLLVLLIVAAAIAIISFTFQPESAEKETPLGHLPADWTFTDLGGKKFQAGDFVGKTVFLNRWATWCGPCVREMPGIQGLYEAMHGQDIVFLLVSDEPAKRVASFVEKRQWSLPVYVAPQGFPPILETQGIPVTFVINRQGDVVFRHEGSRDWNTDSMRRFLKSVS